MSPLRIGLLVLAGCASQADLPVHHLVMGGDLFLSRGVNRALADPAQAQEVLAAIAPRMIAADLTLVNAEGVIALGGTFADKGEPRPHQHHAMPEAADVLRDAGIDIVTMGNNHAGDYGPAALVEARDRLLSVGIDIAGAGQDLAEARSPVYRRIGDTVIAIVGADLTIAALHAARPNRAGIFHLEGMDPAAESSVVRALLGIEHKARQHANVVVFSPHWGENYVREPSPLLRSIAHALIDGGYDAILGHSAHVMHGVELYKGRPIAYDAGDLLLDTGGADAAHQAVLYDLAFTRAGAVSLEAHPIFLESNRTVPAQGEMASTILDAWVSRSRALGTAVTVLDLGGAGVGHLDCDPGAIAGPDEAADPPRRALPAGGVRLAPDETVLDALPAAARPAAVDWPDLGLHLLGTEVLLDQLRTPKAGNIFRLYFRADRPLPADLLIRIDTSPGAPDDHIPGDWLLPGDRWPTGVIVQDRVLLRMVGRPTGMVVYNAGILVGGQVIAPGSADRPLTGGLVEIGRATWSPDGPRLFKVFAADPRSRLGQ